MQFTNMTSVSQGSICTLKLSTPSERGTHHKYEGMWYVSLETYFMADYLFIKDMTI